MSDKQMKAVWINNQTHDKLKNYCLNNGLKMVFLVESLINSKIND
jgi:hypothetical protein